MKRRSAIALLLGCGVLWICACGAPPSSVAPVGAAEPEAAKAPQAAPVKAEAATARPAAATDPASTSLWEMGPEHPVEGPVFVKYQIGRLVSDGHASYSVWFTGKETGGLMLCSDELASLAQFIRRTAGKRTTDSDKVQSATAIWAVPARERWHDFAGSGVCCEYILGADKGFTLTQFFPGVIHEQDIANTLALFTKVLAEVEEMRKVKPSLDP